MKRCRTCLYPDTKPDLYFDESGQCSACIAFEKRKSIDWEAREQELIRVLETAPKNGSGYDCIVPSSGGKDSHWQVLKLLELGATPLVITAETCQLTDLGKKNIDNLARFADTVIYTGNKEARKRLNRLGLQLVGDISWPEHASIFSVPFRAALDFGIPLIFYGENPQEAYGGPQGTDEAKEMTLRWVSEFGGFLGLRPSDFVGMEGLTAQDMKFYQPPDAYAVEKAGLTAYFLGQFYPWDSRRNADVAIENGFQCSEERPYPLAYWKFENLDNLQTPLHDYFMFKKYGYSRACAQFSVDIRNNLIDRFQAATYLLNLEILGDIYWKRKHLYQVLLHCYTTDNELDDLLEQFKKQDIPTDDQEN